MSEEDFKLPDNISGITTLRTTWTKQGILTLTVGIVDPSYAGPLSTAVINFSGRDFPIQKGEPFFRTAFFCHEKVTAQSYAYSRDEYRLKLIKDSASFSESFLTIDTLASEIAPKIIGLPKWGFPVGVIGLLAATILGLFGLIGPPLTQLANQMIFKNQQLEDRIEKLEKEITSSSREKPS